MKLDITEIMNRRKDRLDFSFDFKFPDSPDGALLPAGVTLAGPAQIDCRVTDVNGFIKADFTVHAPLRCVCVRCLEEFEYPLDFSFERFAELDGSDDLDCDADEVLTVKDSALFPDADTSSAPPWPLTSSSGAEARGLRACTPRTTILCRISSQPPIINICSCSPTRAACTR